MDEAERIRTAVSACERMLGRGRRRSMRGRLLAMLDSGYDLVNADSPDLLRTLEERVATLLGKPAAAFFPTGTMAQQVALRCWAERTGDRTVALHPLAHPEQYERHALTTLTGLRTVHPTRAPRPFTAAEVAALDEPFGTLMPELPLRDAGFLLPAWDEQRPHVHQQAMPAGCAATSRRLAATSRRLAATSRRLAGRVPSATSVTQTPAAPPA